MLSSHMPLNTRLHADEAWDQLEDPSSEFWLRKWIQLRPMPQDVPHPIEIDIIVEDVLRTWTQLQNTLPPEDAVKRYNRLLSLQTNQLEGLFRLHGAVRLS